MIPQTNNRTFAADRQSLNNAAIVLFLVLEAPLLQAWEEWLQGIKRLRRNSGR
jgi:hypothetical protein